MLATFEEYGVDDRGRAHDAAAVAFKAKVYAYWAMWDATQWQNVINMVNELEKLMDVIWLIHMTNCFLRTLPSGGTKNIFGRFQAMEVHKEVARSFRVSALKIKAGVYITAGDRTSLPMTSMRRC